MVTDTMLGSKALATIASVDASWKSSWARHSDVPALAKCVWLCLLTSLLARFPGHRALGRLGRHCLARQFSRPKRYASCRGAYCLHGHLCGHTCHASCFTRVAHMCHDMTGPAIMAQCCSAVYFGHTAAPRPRSYRYTRDYGMSRIEILCC